MGRFDDQLKLRTFVRLGNWIACDCRRKAALRADCEPVEVDEARCLLVRRFRISRLSSAATLLLIRPSTSPLSFTKRNGAKSPARSVS
jgi:hypothetical protein